MGRNNLILKTILVLSFVFAGTLFAASCSVNAYRNACSSCSFDANGKIDRDCMSQKKSAGISCVSASYPFLAGEYAQGKCPQVDECSAQLQSCLSQFGSGNDKADCTEGSTITCYTISDQCVATAANKCGLLKPEDCGAPKALIILVIGSVFLVGFVRRE